MGTERKKGPPTSEGTNCHPHWEAVGLAQLVRSGALSPAQVRELIQPTSLSEFSTRGREVLNPSVIRSATRYRRKVLREFDKLYPEFSGARKTCARKVSVLPLESEERHMERERSVVDRITQLFRSPEVQPQTAPALGVEDAIAASGGLCLECLSARATRAFEDRAVCVRCYRQLMVANSAG